LGSILCQPNVVDILLVLRFAAYFNVKTVDVEIKQNTSDKQLQNKPQLQLTPWVLLENKKFI